MDETTQKREAVKDAERKQTKRSEESNEERKMRLLADATRHFEMRLEETEGEHKSRINQQKERQNQLRSTQSTEELLKHDRFYHQKWPIATECQDKPPSSSNQNDEELLNNFPEIN